MFIDLKHILAKVLIVLIIIITYIIIRNNDSNDKNINKIESFEDMIEKEKLNYLKLKETYIEKEGTTLDLLYTNYSGEQLNQKEWTDKTFEQCIDTCNKMNNCIGFSRDAVLDTEPAKCYPRTSLQACYSNRKGNYNQMSKALKYNSYIKSNVPNIINTCIGDSELTLNRIILIKSYSMPNKYIGNNGDGRASMIDKDIINFKLKCNFRIEEGKNNIGTVSFLHIDTNQYLYRDNNNNLIFKDINNNNTEDKQRVSFNINDGLSNGIMFKATPIEGEVKNKYIMIDNNKYIKISTLNNKSNNSNSNSNSNTSKAISTFYIIDTIIDSKIIESKDNLPTITNPLITNPTITKPSITNSTITNQTITKPTITKPIITKPILSKLISNNQIEAFSDTNILDNSSDMPLYNNLFNPNPTDNLNLPNYLEDKYLTRENTKVFTSIHAKVNNTILDKLLNSSLTKNETEYQSLNELNKEIEKEINNQNIDLNVKNDKIINNLDKMRITDLANDYFFMTSIYKK